MRTKTLREIFLLTTGLAIIAACSSGDSSQPPILPEVIESPSVPAGEADTIPDGLCNHILLPVKQGATWLYYRTGDPNGDFAYSDTISEVQPDGFTLVSQFSSHARTQQWACLPEGLKALQLGGGTTASISMQNMIADFKTLEVNGISLPKEITSGLQWQYNISMEGPLEMPGEQAQSPGTFTLTMQELGSETVTVPAGTFEAVKIQATFAAQINADFQGSPVPYAINGSSIIWYAPNVGYVKSIENIDFSGTTFTSTTELQTYNIP